MSFLEQLGFDVLRSQALEYLQDFKAELIAQIRTELETHMADLNAALDALGADIQTELQQLRDAVAAAQAAVNDKAALETALADAQAAIDNASARVEGFSADLKSDDPQA